MSSEKSPIVEEPIPITQTALTEQSMFRLFGITARWPAALSALRHRNYRLFWFGQMVSLLGTWMQNAAQGWLVLLLAEQEFGPQHAALPVGVVTALGQLPMFLFCLFAGVLADRVDRRRILLVTQSCLMLLALALAVLVSTSTVHHTGLGGNTYKMHLWQVAIFTMCTGLVMAVDMPVRQSFVKDMSSPRDLLNAIALNSIIFNLARIFGPAIAGRVIKIPSIDIAGALYINAASFLAVLVGLLLIRIKPTVRSVVESSIWQGLRAGFQYVAHQRVIRLLMALMAVYAIFGFSYNVLLSVIDHVVLKHDVAGYGMMMGSTGAGACVGALFLASTAGRVRKGQVLFWGGLLVSASLIAFSFSHRYLLSLALLPALGGGLVVSSASINSMIQEIVPDHLRGRVVSIWAFIFVGFGVIGAINMGATAHFTTPLTAILIAGVCCLLAQLFVTVRAGWFWRLK